VLKQRIITALCLVPLVLGAIFFLDNQWFALAMAIPVLLGAWEWSNLMGLTDQMQRAKVVGSVALGLLLVGWLGFEWVVLIGALWWVWGFMLVRQYPQGAGQWASEQRMWLIGLVLLVPAWQGLIYLQGLADGSWWVLYAMLLVWGADTGAYFAGRSFGKRKLAPAVSPGKTLEGLFGGIALTSLIALLVVIFSPAAQQMGVVGFLFISVLAVLASVVGDLFESMAKRHRGVKDSSNLLPGHGGVLDRIDSITAAVPVFVAGMMLLKA
jgi:phosphatidate cytidylyltransferase